MATWQLQTAKARFSELVEQAQTDGPQFITRHGAERAVVISNEEYQRLTGRKKDLLEYLLSGPKVDHFEVERDRSIGRKFEFDLD